jgi:hypothetical protein
VQHPVKLFQDFVFIAPFPLPMSLFLLPDPLQRLAELSTTLWSCQVTLPKDATDPPDLKTAKDQGDQTQLDVSRV